MINTALLTPYNFIAIGAISMLFAILAGLIADKLF